MPYKSEKQRRYLHAKHPEIAARWDKEYGGKVVKPTKRGKPTKKSAKNKGTGMHKMAGGHMMSDAEMKKMMAKKKGMKHG